MNKKQIIKQNLNNCLIETNLTELGKKSAKALDLIFDRAQALNGIGDAEIETLAKN